MSQAQEAEDGFVIFGRPLRGRTCGGCTACCTIVPVVLPSGHKPAGERCPHQFSKGCRIYARRPDPCQAWTCRWMFDEDAGGLRRPDLSGYIIDPMLDTITANGRPMEILQVWVDPARRDAHRAPELRAYLRVIAQKHGIPTLVRWSSSDGMILIPPELCQEREWLELGSAMLSEDEMKAKIAEAGGPPPGRFRLEGTDGPRAFVLERERGPDA